MKSKSGHIRGCLARVYILLVVILAFVGACKHRVDEDEANRQAQPTKGTAQVSVENGQTMLTVDSATQKRLGIEVVSLTATVTRGEVTAPAAVLSTQDLAAFRNTYIAMQAQLQKSRIEAGVTRKEYTRLKTLFEENQNVSDKALQSAEGQLQISEADVHAAEQQLTVQASAIRQEWGSTVTGWALSGSPELQSLFDQRAVLVQVTLPYSGRFEPPQSISLEIPGGARTQSKFVSPFPKVDPRIQGKSLLYLASAQAGLYPGLNLWARLSAGNLGEGVVIPSSAVVWSEGNAWVYQEISPSRFARQAVSTDAPVENGFFVTSGVSAGNRVVVQGAQALLSREFLTNTGGESNEQ